MSIRVANHPQPALVAPPSLWQRTCQVVETVASKVAQVWRAVLAALRKIPLPKDFILFRIGEYFYPILGTRVEALYLRVVNAWQKLKTGWREQSLQDRITQLETEKNDLRHSHVTIENERDELRRKNLELQQQGELLSTQNRQFRIEQGLSQEERTHFQEEKEALSSRIASLEREKTAIRRERDSLLQQNWKPPLHTRTPSALTLQQEQIELLRQQVEQANRHEIAAQEYRQQLIALVDEIAATIREKTVNTRTVDQGVEKLLSLLTQQEKDALSHLPPGQQALQRIFTEKAACLSTVLTTLQVHSSINQLLSGGTHEQRY